MEYMIYDIWYMIYDIWYDIYIYWYDNNIKSIDPPIPSCTLRRLSLKQHQLSRLPDLFEPDAQTLHQDNLKLLSQKKQVWQFLR